MICCNLHYEKFADGTVKCIEDEIPFEVPDGWEWCRCRNIVDLFSGQDLEPQRYNSNGVGIPYITGASNLSGGHVIINRWTETPTTHATINDLLLTCKGSGVGKMAICDIEDAHIARQIMALRCTSAICLSYLQVLMSAFITEITYQANGIIPGIRREIVLETLFPLPPYNEQIQIGDRCSALTDLVLSVDMDQAEMLSLVGNIKAKILDLAIRGKLVPQNPNDEPASILLDRIRAEKEELIKQGKIKRDRRESVIFRGEDNSYYEKFGDGTIKCIEDIIPFTLPNGWCWSRLSTLCSDIQYGVSNSAENSGSHRLLRITDIQDGKVEWDKVPFTTLQSPEQYRLMTGDIVFARTGATVGKSFLIKDLPFDSVYASYLIRIRLIEPLYRDYIYNFFNSKYYWNQITDKSVGVGQPNCNGSSLKELLIPIPPLQEQIRIINTVQVMVEKIFLIECNITKD